MGEQVYLLYLVMQANGIHAKFRQFLYVCFVSIQCNIIVLVLNPSYLTHYSTSLDFI